MAYDGVLMDVKRRNGSRSLIADHNRMALGPLAGC